MVIIFPSWIIIGFNFFGDIINIARVLQPISKKNIEIETPELFTVRETYVHKKTNQKQHTPRFYCIILFYEPIMPADILTLYNKNIRNTRH